MLLFNFVHLQASCFLSSVHLLAALTLIPDEPGRINLYAMGAMAPLTCMPGCDVHCCMVIQSLAATYTALLISLLLLHHAGLLFDIPFFITLSLFLIITFLTLLLAAAWVAAAALVVVTDVCASSDAVVLSQVTTEHRVL
jgi:hypothetical protein